jgi:hypothetical protein
MPECESVSVTVTGGVIVIVIKLVGAYVTACCQIRVKIDSRQDVTVTVTVTSQRQVPLQAAILSNVSSRKVLTRLQARATVTVTVTVYLF